MRKNHSIRWYVWVLMVVFLNSICTIPALAATAPVGVKAILPENQIDKSLTRYNLRVGPGQEQVLELKLTNSGSKDSKVHLEVNPATTTSTGSIDYSTKVDEDTRDPSLKNDLGTMLTLAEPTVVVPKNSSIIVRMNLKAPQTEFNGLILGGVRVLLDDLEASPGEQKGKSTMAVKNKVAYVIGIDLTQNDKKVKGDLRYQRTYAAQSGGYNQVNVNLQNPKAAILEDMTYHAEIFKKGSDEVLHEAKAKKYRVAPNSNFDFPVSWENEPFQAGDYRVHMTAKSEESGQQWEWDKKFTITRDEAKRLNDKAVDLKPDYTKYYIIGAIVLVVLILLIIFLIVRSKKKKAAARRRRRNGHSSSSKNKRKSGSKNDGRKRRK